MRRTVIEHDFKAFALSIEGFKGQEETSYQIKKSLFRRRSVIDSRADRTSLDPNYVYYSFNLNVFSNSRFIHTNRIFFIISIKRTIKRIKDLSQLVF
jgi:hypothetical protein